LVSRTILLDSGPLGLITNPRASPTTAACGRWLVSVGALIRSWADMQDGGEQRETIACLVEGLDSERLSARKLFPEELKGRSW
jgi:hypothetical protein